MREGDELFWNGHRGTVTAFRDGRPVLKLADGTVVVPRPFDPRLGARTEAEKAANAEAMLELVDAVLTRLQTS